MCVCERERARARVWSASLCLRPVALCLFYAGGNGPAGAFLFTGFVARVSAGYFFSELDGVLSSLLMCFLLIGINKQPN